MVFYHLLNRGQSLPVLRSSVGATPLNGTMAGSFSIPDEIVNSNEIPALCSAIIGLGPLMTFMPTLRSSKGLWNAFTPFDQAAELENIRFQKAYGKGLFSASFSGSIAGGLS
jgi:hypothetical protein